MRLWPRLTLAVLPGLTAWRRNATPRYREYGFRDAFNPSFQFEVKSATGKTVPGLGWFANDYIGIDQGPILLMAENYRSELIWNVMKTNPYIRAGLQRAGFQGGWLSE